MVAFNLSVNIHLSERQKFLDELSGAPRLGRGPGLAGIPGQWD